MRVSKRIKIAYACKSASKVYCKSTMTEFSTLHPHDLDGHPGYTFVSHDIMQGQAAEVHVVKDNATGKLAVAKMSSGEKGAQALAQESDLLRRCQHEHVVHELYAGMGRVAVVGQNPLDRQVLITEHAGLPLRAHLQGGACAPDKVVKMGSEIGSALAHVHEQGIVHRDVTPPNILLGDDDTARLCDFGLAVDIRQARLANAVGQGGYTPIEQLVGRPMSRSDVYSLAVTLQESLWGIRLAGRRSPVGVAQRGLLRRKGRVTITEPFEEVDAVLTDAQRLLYTKRPSAKGFVRNLQDAHRRGVQAQQKRESTAIIDLQ